MNSMNRRDFIARSALLTGGALLPFSGSVHAEPPPEVKRIRILKGIAICSAPEFLAEEMLRAEGFTEIEYVKMDRVRGADAIGASLADISMWDVFATLPLIDAGKPVVVLAGIHAGCWELFANDRIDSLRDLKGKSIAIRNFNLGDHVLISSMLAYVGIDPKSVNWIKGPTVPDAMRLYTEGKADAFMAFAPQGHELREKKIGRALIDTAQDKPWSQYYCCAAIGNRDFVQANPVATKRVLRAFLKATDICARQPEVAAHLLVEKGYEPRYNVGLEVLKSLPFDRWRDANPEDTLRFYANRLHEVGMIKTTPEKLIRQGTDWRFLNELKKELKA